MNEVEINSYHVKEAVAAAIHESHPKVKCYVDKVSKPIYPNFFIQFVEIATERIGRNLYQFSFYLSVQYRVSDNPSSATSLNTKLEAVGNDLNDILQSINIYGSTRPCYNVRTSVIDNVMQAFATVKLVGSHATKPAEEMEKLQLKEELN